MICSNLNGAGGALEDDLGEECSMHVKTRLGDDPVTVLMDLSGKGGSK